MTRFPQKVQAISPKLQSAFTPPFLGFGLKLRLCLGRIAAGFRLPAVGLVGAIPANAG